MNSHDLKFDNQERQTVATQFENKFFPLPPQTTMMTSRSHKTRFNVKMFIIGTFDIHGYYARSQYNKARDSVLESPLSGQERELWKDGNFKCFVTAEKSRAVWSCRVLSLPYFHKQMEVLITVSYIGVCLKSHVFLFIFNICLSVDIIYHC
jgi:hypothetical protein